MAIVGFTRDLIEDYIGSPPGGITKAAADVNLSNMAGNAFSGGIIAALLISTLIHVDASKLKGQLQSSLEVTGGGSGSTDDFDELLF
eukprot:13677490-Alexandrium_andersonii.AAC.1